MKIMNISQQIKIGVVVALMFVAGSCNIDEVVNPNGPNRSDIQNNATVAELNNVTLGTESLMRDEVGFYYDVVGIVGREYYFFTDSDPRYTGELLGKGASVLDNAGFYGTRPYAGRYRVIRSANILITAVQNTSAALTDEQKNGYLGFAKTAQAYSYLLALNLQYSNGIRIDVLDENNMGLFVSYADALTAISSLLDEAYAELTTAGSEFNFSLSSGFNGFNTPGTFAEFNRAIKARVELYRGNKAAALTALADSFMDMGGDLDDGPQHFYSSSGGDITNPVYRVPGSSEALIAHPSYLTDLVAGDDRGGKVSNRGAAYPFDGLSGDSDVALYTSLSSNIPIIRNEELILIYAEANIGTDNNEAINALDVIRNAHNLVNYAGGTTDAEVLTELLYNRRYSLFGEGHRWIDMRRYDKLGDLPIDRTDDNVWVEFPRPVSEVGVQGG